MSFLMELFEYPHLVLDSAKEAGLLFSGLATLVKDCDDLHATGSLAVEGGCVAETKGTRLFD